MIENKMRVIFECHCDKCGAFLGQGYTAHEASERAKDRCIIVRWYGVDSWIEHIFCHNCRAAAKKIQSYDPGRQLLVFGEEGADHDEEFN